MNRPIIRSNAEWHCIRMSRRGETPSPADICATIYTVAELKGYKDALQRDGRLGEAEMHAIKIRIAQFEALFGRKIG